MSTKSEITVMKTGAALGADIVGVNLAEPLDSATVALIMKAWFDHIVIRFRNQRISDAQLLDVSRHFGTLDKAPISPTGKTWIPGFPELNVISNVVEDGHPIGGLGDGEAVWHSDMSYMAEPASASILYGIEIPVGQGHTWYANQYAAFDELPADLRAAVQGVSVKHDASRNSAGLLRSGFKDSADPREAPGAIHPIVRTHPVTKRKALFLGRRKDAYVMGLSLVDSDNLLDRLFEHATQTHLTWAQEWAVGDLIIWDNRCALHRRDAFDPSARRLLHRAQITGDKPY